MRFITDEQVKELERDDTVIVAAELVKTDGKIKINTIVPGLGLESAMLISALIDSVARKQGKTFSEVLKSVEMAHALQTTNKVMGKIFDEAEKEEKNNA